jgi:membrane protease YdiL (CAAX protease family)
MDVAAGGRQPGTWRVLLGMIGWIALAFLGSIVAGAVPGFVAAFLRGLQGGTGAGPVVSPVGRIALMLAGICTFQATLVAGALRKGLWPGGGRQPTGLGFAPIRRYRLILSFCAVSVLWVMAVVVMMALSPALRRFAVASESLVLPRGLELGLALTLFRLFLIAILAPISEELFFRGWFWEALARRDHPTWRVCVMTSLPWLLLHFDSLGRMLLIVPLAIILPLARHYGGGTRASLLVHLTNNVTAAGIQILGPLL